MLLGALVVLAFSSLEGTFSLYLERRMGRSVQAAAYWFAAIGLVSAVMQGGLIRRLIPRFGERRLVPVGLFLLTAGLAALAVVATTPGLLVAVLLVGFGQGLCAPTVQGLLSKSTPPDEQGAVFGGLLSAQTLARVVNYWLANRLLGRYGPGVPYGWGAVVGLVALGVAAWAIGNDRRRPAGESGDDRPGRTCRRTRCPPRLIRRPRGVSLVTRDRQRQSAEPREDRKTMGADARIAELNLELPPAPKPVATYVTALRHGDLLYVSGHGPLRPDGSMITGKVGSDLDLAGGQAAARQVGLAILATLRAHLGTLDRVERLLKSLGMVNCTPDYADQPKVINGYSDLMHEVFGESGVGSRSAVGMGSLPGNIAVEIEAVFVVRD